MKKKSLSVVIVLTLLLAMTNRFILARDYKEGASAEYVSNFEDDRDNHSDINVNHSNYLEVDYYQTKAFNGLNLLAAPEEPAEINWELFAANILKIDHNGSTFTTDTNRLFGYEAAIVDEDLPKAGGIPLELVTWVGIGLLGLGLVVKKRNK